MEKRFRQALHWDRHRRRQLHRNGAVLFENTQNFDLLSKNIIHCVAGQQQTLYDVTKLQ